ncbi:MAG TPA: radical SAM protein [Anaerovoracaceae bacterium]|nr:radical SAM protein [Anaerovoracaceae bacterium]
MKHKTIFNLENVTPLLKGRIPGQLIIQYTDVCNAACPQCSMRKTENYQRSKLSKDEVYKIIDSAAEKKIQAISFTGGEPFLFKDELIDLIQYASVKGIPLIRTGTNGYMFTNWRNQEYVYEIHALAERLSKTNLRNLWISIDSADAETHEQMRGLRGVIKGIEIALPIFHEYGIYPAANLGINRNIGGFDKISMKMTDGAAFYEEFREAFEKFYRFVIDLGFTMTNACYPMSADDIGNRGDTAVYGAASGSSIVTFSSEEKIIIFKALMDTIPKFRSRIRIFTPLVSLYALIKQYKGNEAFSMPCRGGIDFFYIDAKEGNTYPCGYRGNENLGKFYELDVKSIEQRPTCRACDWECFRDPSEQIGFLIETVKEPLKSIRDKEPKYKKLWREDIKYYNRCSYFNGRIAKQHFF